VAHADITGGFARLTGPVTLAGRVAQSRVLFGPHETNLGQAIVGGGRAFSPRHVAYYRRRAAGGAGLIVTETASVHPSDWPYERARAVLEDTWTGELREIGCAAVVDCGHRLAETTLYDAVRAGPGRPDAGPPGPPRAGDCVAPRTAAEAVLEGRRAALDLGALEREEPPPPAAAPRRQPAAR